MSLAEHQLTRVGHHRGHDRAHEAHAQPGMANLSRAGLIDEPASLMHQKPLRRGVSTSWGGRVLLQKNNSARALRSFSRVASRHIAHFKIRRQYVRKT